MYLTGVKDRNEQIFYRVLTENFKDVAPIMFGGAGTRAGPSPRRDSRGP